VFLLLLLLHRGLEWHTRSPRLLEQQQQHSRKRRKAFVLVSGFGWRKKKKKKKKKKKEFIDKSAADGVALATPLPLWHVAASKGRRERVHPTQTGLPVYRSKSFQGLYVLLLALLYLITHPAHLHASRHIAPLKLNARKSSAKSVMFV
jgi:hypothetical protein